jgi:hypothetical protein
MWIAQAYALKGEHGRAVAEYLETMRLMPVPGSGPDAVSLLNQAYERAGWQAFWQKELDMAEKGGRDRATSAQPGLRRQAFHWGMARRYARVGAEDRALASLEAAYEARENNLIFLKTEPLFDHLRADPRFQQLVRRVGLNP